ncbi:MAG: NifU family protein [Crocinitomicaceae bacterium]|nr:NifU family protein [Crocinitomicaceae bacterium]
MEEKIQIALNSIRPFLQKDGGDVELVGVEGNIVKVRLVGACESCSMQASTLKAGIEEAVRNAIPEIESVQSV